MKKLLIAGLVSVGLVLVPLAANAGHRYHHYGNYGYGHRYNYSYGGHGGHHYDVGKGLAIGAGILAGALLLGALLSPPRRRPAPAYYAPPPRPRPNYGPPPQVNFAPPPPNCVQDWVNRYLPDGRLQWGLRTTCY